jgi:hypothetical protein
MLQYQRSDFVATMLREVKNRKGYVCEIKFHRLLCIVSIVT